MAGKASGEPEELISDINITPLVDVFLVLLIIFMVTATAFIEEQARVNEIPLTLPAAYSGNQPEKEASPVSVVLDKEGRLYLDGRPTELEAVGAEIRARKAQGGPPNVVISADRDLPYHRITRVIDFVQLIGIGGLAINVEDQTIEAPAGEVPPG